MDNIKTFMGFQFELYSCAFNIIEDVKSSIVNKHNIKYHLKLKTKQDIYNYINTAIDNFIKEVTNKKALQVVYKNEILSIVIPKIKTICVQYNIPNIIIVN